MADEITSGASMLAAGAVDGNFLTRLRDIEQRISVLEGANMQAAALDEISSDMGDMRAGRFIAATEGWEPTEADFSGCFISAEGEAFGDDLHNIGGVSNGILQFGLSATDGKAYFMGGAAVIDDGGLFLTGLGTLISMDATAAGVTRHATIGMEVPSGGTAPALTLKSYEPGLGATLVINGTFEADTPGDYPADWSIDTLYPGSDPQDVTVQSAAGSYSTNWLKLVGIGQSPGIVSTAIGVTAGETYYLSAQVENSSNSQTARFGIRWLDSGNQKISDEYVTGLGTAWDSTQGFIAPTGATSCQIIVAIEDDELRIDDILLQVMSSITNVATVQLSPYPTFVTSGGTVTINNGTVTADTFVGAVSLAGTISVDVIGDLTGNVTGNLTGNVTGDLTGDVIGGTASFTSLTGTLNGSVNGGTIGATSAVISGALTAGTLTAQAQGGTPTAPGAGYRTLYPKTDGWYDLNSGGTASRLAYVSEIPTLTYPDGYTGSGASFVGYTAAGAIISDNTITVVSTVTFGGIVLQSTAASAADGVYYILNVPLAAGTYSIAINYSKFSSGGKFDLYMDGVKKSGATPLDTYAAAQTYNNQWDVTGVVIATSGWHVLKILTNGKNASSSDYRIYFGNVVIHRTAA